MNYLVDDFPTELWVNGEAYAIDADWRSCLKIILALEDPELTQEEKVFILLDNLYGENAPEDTQAAVDEALRFLNCFEERETTSTERLYSFQQDAKFILSAMSQARKEDIKSAGFLHWWEFASLFMEISADSMFSRILDIRKRLKKGKLTKEERQLVAEYPEIYRLREPVDEQRNTAAEEFRARLERGKAHGG